MPQALRSVEALRGASPSAEVVPNASPRVSSPRDAYCSAPPLIRINSDGIDSIHSRRDADGLHAVAAPSLHHMKIVKDHGTSIVSGMELELRGEVGERAVERHVWSSQKEPQLHFEPLTWPRATRAVWTSCSSRPSLDRESCRPPCAIRRRSERIRPGTEPSQVDAVQSIDPEDALGLREAFTVRNRAMKLAERERLMIGMTHVPAYEHEREDPIHALRHDDDLARDVRAPCAPRLCRLRDADLALDEALRHELLGEVTLARQERQEEPLTLSQHALPTQHERARNFWRAERLPGGVRGRHPTRELGNEQMLLVHAAQEVTLSAFGKLLDGARGRGLTNDAHALRQGAALRLPDLEASSRLVDEQHELSMRAVGAEHFDAVVGRAAIETETLRGATRRSDVELNDVLLPTGRTATERSLHHLEVETRASEVVW